MPSANPINTPAAPPGAPAASQAARTPDRRLRLDDILKLMVADGLVAAADAEPVARSRTQRYDHPLELIADQKWRSLIPPRRALTLETLVEWLAGKLGIPYHHIDPLKIDLVAVTGTMSIAYAERYRILPVAVAKGELTVATSEPFVRAWADELESILHLKVKLVFANPQDIRRYIGEFFNLARSIKKAGETQRGDDSFARNFEQLVELGKHGQLDANDQHVVHIVDWLWQYAFEQRASDIHIEPRRESGIVRFRIDGVLHQVYAIPNPVLIAMTSRIKLLARMEIVERRRPQDGRIKTLSPEGEEIELRISTMPTAFGEKVVMRIFTPDVLVRDFQELGFTGEDRDRWEHMIKEPYGIILVTGPTGSGKTTTLVFDDEAAGDARGQRLLDRGSDRNDRARVQPDAGAAGDRRRFRERRADAAAPGPRHHHGRRNPRSRHRRHGGAGGADRPSGALDPAHQRRADGDHAPARPRRAAVPDQLDGAGRDGAAPGAHAVPALQGAGRSARPGHVADADLAVSQRRRAARARAGRLSRMPDDGLLRPDRALRDHDAVADRSAA